MFFCSHQWEESIYNEALRLHEGSWKCQKCQAIKWEKRLVSNDYEGEDYVVENTINPVAAIITLTVGIAISFSITGVMKSIVNEAIETNELPPETASMLEALSALLPIIIILVIIVSFMQGILGTKVIIPKEEDE